MSDKELVLLPEGRLINESLFVKNAYTDPVTSKEGVPYYKVELTFDEDDLQEFEEKLVEAAVEKWGKNAEDEYYDGDIVTPLLQGDKLAKKREDKGKEGEAYKGKIVIRAKTIFNSYGDDAPGGISVYDEDVSEVSAANKSVVYPGCYGKAAVVISTYLDNRGDKALTCYLNAFQKTKDGERLVAAMDHSTLFKPVGRKPGEKSKKRKRKG